MKKRFTEEQIIRTLTRLKNGTRKVARLACIENSVFNYPSVLGEKDVGGATRAFRHGDETK